MFRLLSGQYAPGVAPPPHSPWSTILRDKFKSVLPEQAAAILSTVRAIAADHGKSVAQVAMNWVLSHSEVTLAISGSDTIEQLDDNLGALEWDFSKEEIERLDQVSSRVDGVEGL